MAARENPPGRRYPTTVLILRHAEAVARTTWKGDDALRPLTPAGRRTARQHSRWLARTGLVPTLILTSPAVRARDTARAFATVTGAPCRECAELLPGASVRQIRKVLRQHPRCTLLAVVGHEPDLSEAVGALIGDRATRLKFPKGAAAVVRFNRRGQGVLRALLPPFPIIGT